jgi:hypothetical protein
MIMCFSPPASHNPPLQAGGLLQSAADSTTLQVAAGGKKGK